VPDLAAPVMPRVLLNHMIIRNITVPQSSGKATNPRLLAYADGSSLGNPGPGGWAVLITDCKGITRAPLSGSEPMTTNNRMELLAAIHAYEALGPDVPAVLFVDSQYVVNGLTAWLPNWKSRGWRTASGKPVANRDLWERLEALHVAALVIPRWVRGHAGTPLNEAVDRLARAAAEQEAGR
jgi:ribonuclease HI